MVYHLEIELKHCIADVYVNGFPVRKVDGSNPLYLSIPINPFLIGKDNIVDFIFIPPEFKSNEFVFEVKGAIKLYDGDDFSGPDKGEIITRFEFVKQLTGRIVFDNDLFNYSNLFVDGKKFTDENIVLDYGELLKENLKSNDFSRIMEMFSFKIQDFAAAYGKTFAEMEEQFKNYLREKYFANQPMLDFERNEIIVRKWCDDRVCELIIGADGREFMLTRPNSDDLEYVTRIFLGYRGGVLGVVR